jgi:hypothetical protein
MSQSIVRRLVLKDLYLARWLILGSLVLAAATLALTPLGLVLFYVGSVSFLCVLILLNVFVVTLTVAQEKKEKVLLFALSLPISTTQYAMAKMTSSLIAFFVPLVLMGLGAVIVTDLTILPNGMIPFTLLIMAYVALYFCVFLAVALAADSGFWNTIVIIIGNISINFFIAFVFQLPSVVEHSRGETAMWTSDLVTIFVIELALCVVALGLGMFFTLRKKDFI